MLGMKSRKIYIGGPMRGIPQFNFPAFDEAEARWRAAGWTAISPASIDRGLGIDPNDDQEFDYDLLRRAMAIDIQVLYHSDAIALLPGWQKSTGATVELSLAQFLGLAVYDAVTMEQLNIRKTPWEVVYWSHLKGAHHAQDIP